MLAQFLLLYVVVDTDFVMKITRFWCDDMP
jgi:hypothetical protein